MQRNKSPSIILVNPQLPENIGLSARAMMNCGFKDLRIIEPREKWPNKTAVQSSAKAKNIIKNAKIFTNINEATSDLKFLIATSVRKRFLNKKHYYNFNDVLSNITNLDNVGVLFGPEKSGLTNQHISKCDCILTLPTFNNKLSLNLSHSVLLTCYELNKLKKIKNKKSVLHKLATKKEFNYLMENLYYNLKKNGFLKNPEKRKSMFINIQNMFIKAQLSSQEISTFRGIIESLIKQK